jgi:hypothetical protein
MEEEKKSPETKPREKESRKKDYSPPKIMEKKELKVELFSDEPEPWGP